MRSSNHPRGCTGVEEGRRWYKSSGPAPARDPPSIQKGEGEWSWATGGSGSRTHPGSTKTLAARRSGPTTRRGPRPATAPRSGRVSRCPTSGGEGAAGPPSQAGGAPDPGLGAEGRIKEGGDGGWGRGVARRQRTHGSGPSPHVYLERRGSRQGHHPATGAPRRREGSPWRRSDPCAAPVAGTAGAGVRQTRATLTLPCAGFQLGGVVVGQAHTLSRPEVRGGSARAGPPGLEARVPLASGPGPVAAGPRARGPGAHRGWRRRWCVPLQLESHLLTRRVAAGVRQ